MFYSTVLLAATAFSGLVSAQNYSTSGNISVVPDSVDIDTRQAWCRAELISCPEICGGVATSNTCDTDDLTYTCVCQSGATPNISSYSQTLPFYICEQWIIDCVADHPNDLDGQTSCQALVCGSKNASAATTTSSSASSSSAASTSSSAASSTAAATTTGSSTASASASATAKSAAVAMKVAQSYGTAVLGAGLLALFGLVL